MSDTSTNRFPSFLDWIDAKDVPLEPWQWEMVRALDDSGNKEKQQQFGFHVTRQGKTVLHKLWWQYHGERADHLSRTES